MKDAYELLRDKETELARVRRELASLQIVASLLSDDTSDSNHQQESAAEDIPQVQSHPEATGTDELFSFTSASRPRIWNVLRRGK